MRSASAWRDASVWLSSAAVLRVLGSKLQHSCFALLIERRRHDPGDDLISALISAEEDGGALTTAEINATLRLLFVAGYGNVVNLLGPGTLALLHHPEAWAALREDPSLAGGVVDAVPPGKSSLQVRPDDASEIITG
jgi:cytochrome P450